MKYVATVSAEQWSKRQLIRVLKNLDLKEAYIGNEYGYGGYHHYQCAFDIGGDLNEYADKNALGWHIEDCVTWQDAVNYCRKTGNYTYLGSSREEREFRSAISRPRLPIWNDFESTLNSQNDRQITVWIDRRGSSGKSTWGYIMCRQGRAISIPRTESNGHRMNDYICMNYANEEMVILDLPRKKKLTEEHTEVLEDLKDGNLSTAKYQGTKQFIRGVKVIVFTNNWIEPEVYKTLTNDRWDIHVIKDEESEGVISR